MTIQRLNPYLNFNGNAVQAIAHYEKALGAQTIQVMRFRDMPGPELPESTRDKLMHGELRIDGHTLFVSDLPESISVAPGGNQSVCLNFDDEADLRAKYDALVVGGTATFPPHEAFWGAVFGMLVDAYGINWMFNFEKSPAQPKAQ